MMVAYLIFFAYYTKSNQLIYFYSMEEQSPVSTKSSFAPYMLPGAIVIAALLISGTLVMTRGNTAAIGAQADDDTKPAKIDVKDNDHILGNKDAKVTIFEFSDFQCPFCRVFEQGAYAQIKKDYIDTGKARLIYRHYPLDFHPQSKLAAEASECAGEQGKFWEMHDKMFAEQEKKGSGTTITFTANDVKKWASAIGVKAAQFNTCLDTNKYDGRINDDINFANSIGVSGTPTFFINGARLVGAQPFASFKAAIDILLK
jgi:protein-disulfide isomerase